MQIRTKINFHFFILIIDTIFFTGRDILCFFTTRKLLENNLCGKKSIEYYKSSNWCWERKNRVRENFLIFNDCTQWRFSIFYVCVYDVGKLGKILDWKLHRKHSCRIIILVFMLSVQWEIYAKISPKKRFRLI